MAKRRGTGVVGSGRAFTLDVLLQGWGVGHRPEHDDDPDVFEVFTLHTTNDWRRAWSRYEGACRAEAARRGVRPAFGAGRRWFFGDWQASGGKD